MSSLSIRPLALCIFHHSGRILVNEAHDPVKNLRFCRPLGGGIEFGETSQATIVREIQEELSAQAVQLRLIGTLESIFTYRGKLHHEIIQVYDGAFADLALYAQPWLPGAESDGTPFQAVWREMAYFTEAVPLVPEGLAELLRSNGFFDRQLDRI